MTNPNRYLAPEIIEDLVVHTLEMLLEISQSTNQRIPFLPKPHLSASGDDDERVRRVELRTFDLSEPSERVRLANLFMDEPKPKANAIYKDWQQKPLSSSFIAKRAQPPVHVGRNDPCPCGSGKKYKKCCYR